MMHDVSVIVPVKNREELVSRCLDSIRNQTEKPRELIVVDNASTDSTYRIVDEWMNANSNTGINFKLLKEEIPGACSARQKGFENAESEWVLFFDSDDAMNPDLIHSAFTTIDENEGLDLVCWKCRINQLDGTSRIPPFNPEKPLENHLIHALLRPQGYLIKKSFLNNAGGWTKQIAVWNDFELGLRILLQNPEIKGIPKVLAEIYSQEESITGKDFSSKEGKWETTLREMEKEISNSSYPERKRLLRIIDYRKVILAAHYFKEGNEEGASKLLNNALKDKTIREKLPLLFSYHYTRKGLRGVWRLVRHII